MRGRFRQLAIAVGALLWCGSAPASEAVLDETQPAGGDLVPTLRIKAPEEIREDRTSYDHEQLMCEAFDYCPPPTPKGVAKSEREPVPQKGITIHLRRPQPAPAPVPYATIATPHVAEAVQQLDEIVVYGQPISPWHGDLGLSRIEKLLPCLGCDGTSRAASIALHYGVDTLFTLMRGFFQQPRVRGEPNDEALYLAHDGCAEDNTVRCVTRPQLP